jgi:transposase
LHIQGLENHDSRPAIEPARRGKKRAVIAVAHSILVILYHMLRQRQPYHELGSNFFDQRDKTGLQRRLVQRLEKLGYTVELHSPA